MEGGSSEGDRKQNPEGEEPRVKRKMKTAAQLEVLEKTYRVDTYPSESLRAELSVQLGLTDRQLQMWFCHRRLKDRKEPSEKRRRKRGGLPSAATFPLPPSLPASASVKKDEIGGEFRKEHSSGSGGSGCSPYRHLDPFQGIIPWPGVSGPRISVGAGLGRCYEPPQSISELRAIAFIEVQFGESLREDGPALGMEFLILCLLVLLERLLLHQNYHKSNQSKLMNPFCMSNPRLNQSRVLGGCCMNAKFLLSSQLLETSLTKELLNLIIMACLLMTKASGPFLYLVSVHTCMVVKNFL